MKSMPPTGSPPMPMQVVWPMPRALSCPTASYVRVPDFESTAMGRRVDALGKTTDDAEARAAEVAGKLEGIAAATLGRVAAAHDGERRQVQQLRVAFDVQALGRARDTGEEFGKVGVAAGDQVVAGGLQPVMFHSRSLKKTAPESAVFIY